MLILNPQDIYAYKLIVVTLPTSDYDMHWNSECKPLKNINTSWSRMRVEHTTCQLQREMVVRATDVSCCYRRCNCQSIVFNVATGVLRLPLYFNPFSDRIFVLTGPMLAHNY